MLRFTATVAAVLLLLSPAHASVGIWCTGPEGVSFDAPLSGGIGLKVMSATVEAKGRTWTTETSLEDPQGILPAQTWGGVDFLWFDFSDTNFERNVVEVRVDLRGEGEMTGTISILDVGKWDLTCDVG